MPAYFYHISFEVLRSPRSSISPAAASSLPLESAWEALLPFQRRPRHSSSSPAAGSSQSKAHDNSVSTKDITLERRPKVSLSSSIEYTPPYNASRSNSSSPSIPLHPSTSPNRPSDLQNDVRYGSISIECIDMVAPDEGPANRAPKRGNTGLPGDQDNLVAAGIGTDILGGLRTKGQYIPLDQELSDSVWGIVHLYRDAQETPYLAGNDDDYPTYLKGSAAAARHPSEQQSRPWHPQQGAGAGASHRQARGKGSGDPASYPFPVTASSSARSEEDCSTLCILAVPSYLSPSDFLGFVGESSMDEISHFRMIRTSRANRYMVLLKFRSGKKAKEWQKEWNGKVFNSMEPETCHVVFVKSVEIQVVEPDSPPAFSSADAGALSPSHKHSVSSAGQATLSSKPLAPPTPALIELPTCPVCLERMDETTGLLTIICQHVFHCTCLQKWKGSGCPVCRYTQDDFRKGGMAADSDEDPAECSVCHSELNLWACLICGSVGCGRYDGAHAFDHWKQTAHAFAMDLTSQRVWDYVGDAYVHRIIQSKSDGKLVELPAADNSALDPPDWADAVPREKLENMSVEYTHLLTSQLESQRAYFEEVVERAADKASQAGAAAAAAEKAAHTAATSLADLQARFDALSSETIPTLERDRTRLEKRAEKFEALARRMEKDYREEKTMNQSLMEKLDHLTEENRTLKAETADLQEQNRDLTFFISGSQRLQGQSEDIVQGVVSVPEPETKKKKNKGKGRK
ncbi:RING finger protein ETP1 [Penicillium macrosclerotiorum]|uniref:RING finger protein ETP1 n=1 Tax=Penicillium macrosclerotiorum TaxID=303699 RepID=UPI0025478B0E|nr:RING finger protein ETP1 [Penicillium macrosclerotiorum]KAJ5669403.1 RING finger protein ETP1 [Penicillium macrosclerotiorum]